MKTMYPYKIDDLLDFMNQGFVEIDESADKIRYFKPKQGYKFPIPNNMPIIFQDENDPKKACILYQNLKVGQN